MESMSASPWPLPDAARPRLLKCNATVEMDGADGAMEGERAGSGKAKHKPAFHFRSDLQPVSRFSEKELRVHWLALASFVLEDRNPTSTPVHLRLLGVSEDDEIIQAIEGWQSTLAYSPSERDATDVISPEDIERLYTKSTNPTAIPIPDPAGLEENSHSFIRISVSSLDNAQFDVLWGRGEPIVVDDVDKRLKQSWTPDAFIEQYGHDLCRK
jgi:lysine-specific demethylase 3